MTDRAEVVVIGGGIVGAACAYFLASAGLEVHLVEQRFPASGTSRGSLQDFPSSSEKITWEFFRLEFSRSSTAMRVPSGERMQPGSHKCTSEDW